MRESVKNCPEKRKTRKQENTMCRGDGPNEGGKKRAEGTAFRKVGRKIN